MTCFRISYSSFHSTTSDHDISKGAIAGIIVGVLLGVAAFSGLCFILWRRRRRIEDFTFIEPSIHKGRDIVEVLDIRSPSLSQRRRKSSVSEISLDLFPVSIPQSTRPRSRASPPTFPRSPTTSSLSPTKGSGGHDIVHLPLTRIDQVPSVHIRSPSPVNLVNSRPQSFSRRGSVPKPSGPRPQSYRTSSCDPRPSVVISASEILTDPDPVDGKDPNTQQANDEEGMVTYSFLDMNSTSEPPSIREGPGNAQSSDTRPLSHTNSDSLRHPPFASTSSVRSHRDSDRPRESRKSKHLSLSAVIRQLTPLKLRQSTELHPYSSRPPGYPQTPHSHRPPTGGASPTDSVPVTTSEVSEIRFYGHGECSESNASQERNRPDSHPPSPKATAVASPIYQKLFGTQQGEVPADGLLAKKRPLRRKQLSTSSFDTPPRG